MNTIIAFTFTCLVTFIYAAGSLLILFGNTGQALLYGVSVGSIPSSSIQCLTCFITNLKYLLIAIIAVDEPKPPPMLEWLNPWTDDSVKLYTLNDAR